MTHTGKLSFDQILSQVRTFVTIEGPRTQRGDEGEAYNAYDMVFHPSYLGLNLDHLRAAIESFQHEGRAPFLATRLEKERFTVFTYEPRLSPDAIKALLARLAREKETEESRRLYVVERALALAMAA